MLSLDDQIRLRKFVCPRTRQPLTREADRLVTPDRETSYPVIAGVPILLCDPEVAAGYLALQSGSMVAEYTQSRRGLLRSVYERLTAAVGDQRTPESEQSFRVRSPIFPRTLSVRRSAADPCGSIRGWSTSTSAPFPTSTSSPTPIGSPMPRTPSTPSIARRSWSISKCRNAPW